MSADANLKHAQNAIKLTKSHVSCSNNLRGDRLASFDNGIDTLVDLWKNDPGLKKHINNPKPISNFIAPVHNDANTVRSAGIQPNSLNNLKLMVINVMNSGTGYGNCMEQSAFAFIYLYQSGVKPLDYMCFSSRVKDKRGRALYDHAWVVIGRDGSGKLDDMRSWGKEAVWCDPWQMKEGRAFKISDLIAGKVRNLDWQFRLDSAERIEAGKPASLVRYQ